MQVLPFYVSAYSDEVEEEAEKTLKAERELAGGKQVRAHTPTPPPALRARPEFPQGKQDFSGDFFGATELTIPLRISYRMLKTARKVSTPRQRRNKAVTLASDTEPSNCKKKGDLPLPYVALPPAQKKLYHY